jgi:DNA (cytosine-5)-methyltransferase 1
MRTIAYSEIEVFAIENLLARMEGGQLDAAPIWSDLKSFPWAEFSGKVDILSGGYPCQPFSSAGKRLGKEDPRHLWPWIADGIRILRPRVCFFENVEGHISLGLSSVISDLEELGYKVAWGIFSAREVGAPHQRKRVFILAHTKDQYGRHTIRPEAQDTKSALRCQHLWPSSPGEPQHGWEPPRVVASSKRSGGEEPEHLDANLPSEPSGCDPEGLAHSKLLGRRGRSDGDAGGLRGEIQTAGSCGGWGEVRETEPPLGGSPDGPADWLDYAELYTTCDNRTDELRLLGNGVVPAAAEQAFRILMTELLTNKQP